jgi:hypothetical protein
MCTLNMLQRSKQGVRGGDQDSNITDGATASHGEEGSVSVSTAACSNWHWLHASLNGFTVTVTQRLSVCL